MLKGTPVTLLGFLVTIILLFPQCDSADSGLMCYTCNTAIDGEKCKTAPTKKFICNKLSKDFVNSLQEKDKDMTPEMPGEMPGPNSKFVCRKIVITIPYARTGSKEKTEERVVRLCGIMVDDQKKKGTDKSEDVKVCTNIAGSQGTQIVSCVCKENIKKGKEDVPCNGVGISGGSLNIILATGAAVAVLLNFLRGKFME